MGVNKVMDRGVEVTHLGHACIEIPRQQFSPVGADAGKASSEMGWGNAPGEEPTGWMLRHGWEGMRRERGGGMRRRNGLDETSPLG